MERSAALNLSFRLAGEADGVALLALRLAVDRDQERRFGKARWTTAITEKSIARGLRTSRILLASREGEVIATLRMERKKPWAIDLADFTPARQAVYLHDVDVAPHLQRQGVGRRLMEEAKIAAREWMAEAIRVDAYDGPSGAGAFYAKCGFKEVGHKTYRSVPLVYFEMLLNRSGEPDE
jgi:predicted N-acetyltransferase YhbS